MVIEQCIYSSLKKYNNYTDFQTVIDTIHIHNYTKYNNHYL